MGGPRRWLTVGVALAILLLAACEEGAASQGDERLRSVADRLSAAAVAASFPWTAEPGDGGSLAPEPTATATGGGTAQIGETGGVGVSLRSGCDDDARVPGSWADTIEVTILELGADACAGWSLVEADGIESWVRDEYLVNRSEEAPAAAGGGATVSDPRLGQLQPWVEALLDGAGRVSLLSRHAPDSDEAQTTRGFLVRVTEDMNELATRVEAASAFEEPACESARRQVITAATELGRLATGVARFFDETGAPDVADVNRRADVYIDAQTAMTSRVKGCAETGPGAALGGGRARASTAAG